MKHLSRNWILHNDPRFIRVTGEEIKDQLLGDAMVDHELGCIILVDHELGCIILQRQKQLDHESNPDVQYLNHRHILEVDFSTVALCGTSISDFLEVQNQFIGPSVYHAIEACQLFYVPAILRDGWAIQVFDPSVGPKGCSQDQQARHELIASCLHNALFGCLHAGWPTRKDNWSTISPVLWIPQLPGRKLVISSCTSLGTTMERVYRSPRTTL